MLIWANNIITYMNWKYVFTMGRESLRSREAFHTMTLCGPTLFVFLLRHF